MERGWGCEVLKMTTTTKKIEITRTKIEKIKHYCNVPLILHYCYLIISAETPSALSRSNDQELPQTEAYY